MGGEDPSPLLSLSSTTACSSERVVHKQPCKYLKSCCSLFFLCNSLYISSFSSSSSSSFIHFPSPTQVSSWRFSPLTFYTFFHSCIFWYSPSSLLSSSLCVCVRPLSYHLPPSDTFYLSFLTLILFFMSSSSVFCFFILHRVAYDFFFVLLFF